jgi:hypothetical protein
VALQRVWSHPERLANDDEKRASHGIVTTLAAKAVTAVASVLLTRLAKILLVQKAAESAVRN